MTRFYTYVLQCADGTRFSGQTYNLRDRLEEHRRGEIRATRFRLPVRLVWFQVYPTRKAVSRARRVVMNRRRSLARAAPSDS